MKSRSFQLVFVLVTLILISMACDLPFNAPFSDIGSLVPLPSGISLGETYRSEIGGFSLSKIGGYSFKDEFDIVRMTASDAKGEVGPEITAVGGLNAEAATNQQILDQLKASSDAPKTSDQKEVTISGVKGLSANLTTKVGGVDVKGRIVVVMFTPTQQFVMLGISPVERWDKEVGVIFEKVLQTVSLFKITQAPSTATPQATQTAKASPTRTLQASVTPQKATATQSPTATLTASTNKPVLLRQWAKSAVASSQFGTSGWSAKQATGAPNTPDCGDSTTAWAAAKPNTLEWIELTYETPVTPTEITIYQTFNPSQVTDVMIITTSGEKFLVHSSEPEYIEFCPDEYTISLELNEMILVNKVRITVDQRYLGDFNEIDAVELVGWTAGGTQPTATRALPTTSGQKTATIAATKAATLAAAAPGTFNYQVVGAGEDATITSGSLQYQSVSTEYVIGLNSTNLRYGVSLFIPKNIAPGTFTLKPYDTAASSHAPNTVIFIGAWFYYGQGGTLEVNRVENGTISGSFTFTAVHQQDSSKSVSVTGTFNKIPLSK